MKRLCPKCGKKSEEARCPEDGTATLVLAANPDSRLAEGTEVNGRYRIRNMIGQGGFGAVYRATNIATDQDMAIKLLAVSLDSDDSDVIQRFFAEAQVTASLKHPNTIRVFDFGQTEGGALYIAMELLSGRPLNDVLKRRAAEGRVMTEEETTTIGIQVLRSLAEAHLAQLVHRDLKPHNVFLHEVEGDDAVVKVLDFGIAKRLGSNLTGTGKAFGTPSYMSPEQAQNQKIDHRSDLYSLGCVLYQCVTGKPPFDGDDPLAVLLAHVTRPPPDLRTAAATPVSEAFVAVVEKALAKLPEERFATALEFRQALEACRSRHRAETSLGGYSRPSANVLAADAPERSPVDRTVAYVDGHDERTSAYVSPVGPITSPTAKAQKALAAWAKPEVQADDEEAVPAGNRRSGKKLLAIGAAIAATVAAVGILATGNSGAGNQAQEKTVEESAAGAVAANAAKAPGQAGTENAEKAGKPAAEPAGDKAAEAQKASELSKTAEDPKAAAAEVEVALESDPPGATVLVGRDTLGKTPLPLKVPANGRVDALLRLNGYRDLDVALLASEAPRRLVKLTENRTPKVVNPGKKVGDPKSDQKKKDSEKLDERMHKLDERM